MRKRARERSRAGRISKESVAKHFLPLGSVTTMRTRIINPRTVMPACTLYLPVITIFFFNILSISPVLSRRSAPFSPRRDRSFCALREEGGYELGEGTQNAYALLGESRSHTRGVNRRIYVRFRRTLSSTWYFRPLRGRKSAQGPYIDDAIETAASFTGLVSVTLLLHDSSYASTHGNFN